MRYFKSYLHEMFSAYVKKQSYDVPIDYVLNLAVCSFSETVKWWITDHEQYSPEQITSFLWYGLNNILKNTLE